jgi:hypothetical protein
VRAFDVPIATMTLARDEVQAAALLGALTRLAHTHPRLFVADGGSSPAFLDALRRLPVTLVPTEGRGLVAQVRAAVAAAASSATRVFYTEPDKHDFFDRHLDGFLAAACASDASIVLAARSAAAFATFPAFQRYTESTFNRLCGEFAAAQADYLYGPFLMDATLAATLGSIDPALGWGWRPFLFARAHHQGHRIASVAGEFECPVEQRDDPERVHRLRQLQQNVAGLVAGITQSDD